MTADPTTLKHLLEIQDHDRVLDNLTHRRANLGEFAELEQANAALSTLSAEKAQVAEQRHGIERDQKRLEDEVALVEDRIKAEDAKLYSGTVTGVKELTALQDEIAGLKDRQRRIEDNILDVMELAEPVDAALQRLADSQRDIEASQVALQAKIDVEQAEIDDEIDRVRAERARLAADIDSEILVDYARLNARPGAVGIAQLVGSTCRGCHLDLPAVEVDRLKKLPPDELVHCDECGCILAR